jgi:hypothetical protein
MFSVHSAYHVCLLVVNQFCTVQANNSLLVNSVLMFVQCIGIICRSPKRSWDFFLFFLLYALILHVIVIFQLYVWIVLCFIVSMSDFWQYSARRSILYCTFVVWSHCSFLYVRLEVSMLLGSWYQRFMTLFTHMCRDIQSRYLVCNRINHVSVYKVYECTVCIEVNWVLSGEFHQLWVTLILNHQHFVQYIDCFT